MNYRERTTSEISIMRGMNGIKSVLVTRSARRKFHLMQEDSVTLVFSLSEAYHFRVGDYINDELFGMFYIREEQMPTYNVSTGGYDYALRFDADYWMAENHLFMLTGESGETWKRKEATWNLTAPLITHANEIVRNYKALGIGRLDAEGVVRDIEVAIDTTATHAGEAKHLAYDGVHIISALNQIADAYECEWWFEWNVLHFGKCGGEGDADLDFILAVNVESMEISKNQNDYANRIYALGGTNNIPDSYRRKLMLDIDTVNGEYFLDSSKKLTQNMLVGSSKGDTLIEVNFTEQRAGGDSTETLAGFTLVAKHAEFTTSYDAVLSWNAIVGSADLNQIRGGGVCNAYLRISIDAVLVDSDNMNKILDPTKDTDHISLSIREGSISLGAGTHYVNVEFRVESKNPRLNVNIDDCSFSYPSGMSKEVECVYNNARYHIILNSEQRPSTDSLYYMFKFKEGMPQGFGVGSRLELLGYDPSEIPFSWYVEDLEDPSSLLSLGERRLRLPQSLGREYVELEGLRPEQIVERYVKVDSIFPKCYLKVTSVSTQDRWENMQHSDGTTRRWSWTAFTLQAEQVNGAAFPFKAQFVRDGDKLQAVFLSEMDTDKAYREMGMTPPQYGSDNYLLAGMTFDVDFTNGKYTLVRNEDYGAKLPSLELHPSVGDVFVLTGWDVKNMSALNLIETAEDRLKEFIEDYLNAMEEGQWTFTCHMMSDWPFLLFGGHETDSEPLHESKGKPFHSATDDGHEPFHVRLGKGKYGYIPFFDADVLQFIGTDNPFFVPNTEYYIMPFEGVRVRIVHDALKDGSKTSRIIGYELKLDKPYDTPTYTVGDTDAFSRLKQLEKQLQNAR